MIRAILFDLGGVVVDYSNSRYYKCLGEKCKIPASRVKRVIEGRYLEMLEKDIITIDSFESKIASELGIQKRKMRWYEFYKRATSINLDVRELVNMLHKEYITAYITNIDKTRYSYTLKILDLNDFDYRFASCYIGSRKPEPKIFRYALRKIGIRADQAVFIDNMLENVTGARRLGIKSIHFINRRMLDMELARLGV